MRYFNGFCFKDEHRLFLEYLDSSEYCVSGFSYGAIKAVKFLSDYSKRVDKLQLFSPAFFQNRSKKYKSLQIDLFKKDRISYIKNFIKNSVYPSSIEVGEFIGDCSVDELEELLNFTYDEKIIEDFINRGIEIEIYLGDMDKVVDSESVFEFFKPFATIYRFKNRGHILYG